MSDNANPTHGSTNHSLLAGERGDEQAAWTRLVSLYAPSATASRRRWGVLLQHAMDVAQDFFASAARSLTRIRREHPQGNFRGGLATIADVPTGGAE